MARTGKESLVLISDDEDEDVKPPLSALSHGDSDDVARKRKIEDGIIEKVEWTDHSDEALPVKPKKRRAKRKSGKPKRVSGALEGEQPEAKVDTDLTELPAYLRERRHDFDAKRKEYHESALMVPPDFGDIDNEDSEQLASLQERPQFDDSSGIKPSRPYEDVELPLSGGLIPASIAQYLRDYQIVGVKFLHRKFVYQEGGILGDDMGLGKTVQVAAFLTAAFGKTGDERDAKRMRQIRYRGGRWYPRILILCPGSLIMNWRNEMDRWGWWHIDVFHGPNKEDILDTARAGLLEIMITTYETYKNNRSAINMVQWDAVIADECHRLKDRSSETTKAVTEVNALCRIGLTGTAIQNKYEELWTLLDWTSPGHFGSLAEWQDRVARPLTVGQSHDATASQLSLARRTAKKLTQNLLPRYFLRRMKSLIADQLPKKTDRVVFCPLTDLQLDAYKNFLDSYEVQLVRTSSDVCQHGNTRGRCCGELLPSGKPWQSFVFPSMQTLQKLSNHLTLLLPRTVDQQGKQENELRTLKLCMPDTWKSLYEQRDNIRMKADPEFCGKWKVLKKLLKFWHSNGDKVLVFSHSVQLLRILQHLFTNTSYTVSYLDGQLKYEQRQAVVDDFNSDPMRFVFLISTKAGGVGLNITSANKVVIVDPHWNPAFDLQAQDRAYRIGQTRDVEVFRLISLGSIEEVVYARQIYKQQQANIGYTASSERRYFKGVQQEPGRRGEIFGLANILTYHSESGLLRHIVNKTNVAEAKAGVEMVDVDMEKAADDDDLKGTVKEEDAEGEDGGISQLAKLFTSDPEAMSQSHKSAPKSDPIQAILTSAGVEYTHDNSEVVGSSKIEEQLSRHAEMLGSEDPGEIGQSALFASSQGGRRSEALHSKYNPPEDVMLRQFCEMAHEFGFVKATEFALVVESWTQEARRNCLNAFYRRREAKLLALERMRAEEKTEALRRLDEELAFGIEDEVKREDPVDEKGWDMKDEKPVLSESEDKVPKLEKKIKSDPATSPLTMKIEEDEKSTVRDSSSRMGPAGQWQKAIRYEKGTSKRTSIFLSDDEDDEL